MPSASRGPRPGCAVVRDLRLLVQRAPMPCPTNSRTTEKPCASTCSCTAWPMIRDPRAQPHPSMAPCSASSVTRSSSAASSRSRPTGTVTAASPKNPSSARRGRSTRCRPRPAVARDGMPCTTSSFTDAQSVAGYPRYPLNAGSRARVAHPALGVRVEVGGRDAGRDHRAQFGAARRPRARWRRASARAPRPTCRRSRGRSCAPGRARSTSAGPRCAPRSAATVPCAWCAVRPPEGRPPR